MFHDESDNRRSNDARHGMEKFVSFLFYGMACYLGAVTGTFLAACLFLAVRSALGA